KTLEETETFFLHYESDGLLDGQQLLRTLYANIIHSLESKVIQSGSQFVGTSHLSQKPNPSRCGRTWSTSFYYLKSICFILHCTKLLVKRGLISSNKIMTITHRSQGCYQVA